MKRPAHARLQCAALVSAASLCGCAQLNALTAKPEPAPPVSHFFAPPLARPDWMTSTPPPAATAGCPHIPAEPAPGKPPKPPASDFPQTLQPGHWEWSELTYTWFPPRWVIVVAGGHPIWRPGFWVSDHGACSWRAGHWFIPPVPRGI